MFYSLSNDFAVELSPGVSGKAHVWVGKPRCEKKSTGASVSAQE